MSTAFFPVDYDQQICPQCTLNTHCLLSGIGCTCRSNKISINDINTSTCSVVFRSGLTMLIPTLLLSFLCLSLSEPGAPWTEEEAKIVKGKIYAILGGSIKRSEDYLLNHPELKSELNEYVTMVRRDQPEWKWPEWPEAASRPNVPKLIRLGFHQCLKNSDGTGGCNGCLNNHGM